MAAQVVAGAQTTKINSSGSSATGVTFTTKGPDGKRHVGAYPQAPLLPGSPHRRPQVPVLCPVSADVRLCSWQLPLNPTPSTIGSSSHCHLHSARI